jgi:hypothetical protein
MCGLKQVLLLFPKVILQIYLSSCHLSIKSQLEAEAPMSKLFAACYDIRKLRIRGHHGILLI